MSRSVRVLLETDLDHVLLSGYDCSTAFYPLPTQNDEEPKAMVDIAVLARYNQFNRKALRLNCVCLLILEGTPMTSTANQRMKNQRQARIQAGWHEVRVWVPTKGDAEQVYQLAANLRARLLNRQDIENLPGVKAMDEAIRMRVLEAIENQGSTKYVTPSGPILDLLSELAKEGHLADMATAFNMFRVAYPSNARFVAGSIAAKVVNHYVIPSLGLNGANQWERWQNANGTWGVKLIDSLPTDQFQNTVDGMLADIKNSAVRSSR